MNVSKIQIHDHRELPAVTGIGLQETEIGKCDSEMIKTV